MTTSTPNHQAAMDRPYRTWRTPIRFPGYAHAHYCERCGLSTYHIPGCKASS